MGVNLKPKDFTMFNKSRPWGYKPDEVEDLINELKNTIRLLNDKVIEQKQLVLSQQQKIERLQEELRKMHIEMSSLELPETSQAVEDMVLQNFAAYNSTGQHTNYEEVEALPQPKIIGNEADSSDESNNQEGQNKKANTGFTIIT